jgi:hypothetical protein
LVEVVLVDTIFAVETLIVAGFAIDNCFGVESCLDFDNYYSDFAIDNFAEVESGEGVH